jgi:exodeoxyribonuclease-3
VRLVAWNLLHGGGARVAAIAAELLRHDADVLVLSEYRSARGAELAALLRAGGYEAVVTTDPPPRVNGLAVLAREPVARCPAPPGALTAQRWLEVDLPGRELAVAAVHVPPVISVGEEAKQAFWDLLLAWAAAHQAEPVLLVGDLNTGAPGLDERGATLYCAPSFLALGASGWVDAWRHFHGDRREWTWRTPRRRYGYRIDHAFSSPPLVPRLRACRYVHEPREARVSDHSLLVLELAAAAAEVDVRAVV